MSLVLEINRTVEYTDPQVDDFCSISDHRTFDSTEHQADPQKIDNTDCFNPLNMRYLTPFQEKTFQELDGIIGQYYKMLHECNSWSPKNYIYANIDCFWNAFSSTTIMGSGSSFSDCQIKAYNTYYAHKELCNLPYLIQISFDGDKLTYIISLMTEMKLHDDKSVLQSLPQ